MPQVEVSFDIDANGIVHVSAKDLGTGTEQSIEIKASSGLSDDDIDDMVSDAKKFESEDGERRKTVEAKNKLDTMVYQTDKLLGENREKLDEATISSMEGAIESAKKALDPGEDRTELEAQFTALEQASHAMAQALYASQNQQQGPGGDGGEPQPGPDAGQAPPDDDVVDAEFTEEK